MIVKVIDGRTHLFADEGKMVTDGAEIYGKEIALEVGLSSDGFYEITEEEYAEMFTADENMAIGADV